MNTGTCVYNGTPLNPSSTTGDRPTLEHIIPLSMGGCDAFAINDVSEKANSRAGSEIDGALANDPLVSMQRQTHLLTGHSGTVPAVNLELSPLGGRGQRGRLTFSADKEPEIAFPPSIQGSLQESADTGMPMMIESHMPGARKVLQSVLHKAESKGLSLRTLDKKPIDSVEDAIAASSSVTYDTVHSVIHGGLMLHRLERFALKASLAYAHMAFGAVFTGGIDAQRLRDHLWEPTLRWSAAGIRGFAGVGNFSLAATLGLAPTKHFISIQVIESDLDTPVPSLVAFGSLFGVGPLQWALELSSSPALVQLARKRDVLTILDAKKKCVEITTL